MGSLSTQLAQLALLKPPSANSLAFRRKFTNSTRKIDYYIKEKGGMRCQERKNISMPASTEGTKPLDPSLLRFLSYVSQ